MSEPTLPPSRVDDARRAELIDKYNAAMERVAALQAKQETDRVAPLSIANVATFAFLAALMTGAVWDTVAHHGSARSLVTALLTTGGLATTFHERSRPTRRTLLIGVPIGLALAAASMFALSRI